TGQPACVQIFENANRPANPLLPADWPGALPTRTNTAEASAASTAPSGKTVTTPPGGTWAAMIGWPRSSTSRRPPAHGVTRNELPTLGPSDLIGTMAATPIATK